MPAPAPKFAVVPADRIPPPLVTLGRLLDAPGGEMLMNLSLLVAGRLLIQGNSGAGKSMLLRRIFEQAFGRVQQLLIDPDGEFSTIAEVFDVAVIDAAEISRVGGMEFAHHLRQHRYSAVLDLSDATAEDRLEVVADLATGLIESPPAHWTPLLVLIDEAQTFAPHYDTGDIAPETRKRALAALADLMGRGRKRGVAGVIATQRLAETSKAVVSKATNVVVGRTIFDRDVDRAGTLLGFTASPARRLAGLADGEFICIGPAFAGPKRLRFKAGDVRSRHKGKAPAIARPPEMSAADTVALLQSLPAAARRIDAAPAARRVGRPGRRGRDWDPREDAIVAAGYRMEPSRPIKDISGDLVAAGFPIRALSTISVRAQQLGLASSRLGVAWTEAEDQIIADGYAREVKIMDIVGLLQQAGYERSRVSIQMRAITLGITRDRVNYWTEPEKKIARSGLEGGKPYREILADLKAAGFERGLTGIFKFAQKNNFNRAAPSWTPEQLERLKVLYAARTPVRDIAAELGHPEASIRTKASLLGIHQRQAWTDAERQILIDACTAGETLIDAAKKIGRPYANVAAVASRMGLDFRKTGRAK